MTLSARPAEILANRRWRHRQKPFPHFVAENVFISEFARALEQDFQEILNRGLAEYNDPERFARNMLNSDAYAWNFPPEIEGSLAVFYSLAWHELLCCLTKVECTMDVNGALHHHHVHSRNGSVHRDLGVGWFSTQKRRDGVNPMDLSRCSYTHGTVGAQTAHSRETVRAVTMIYYLANQRWSPGDGGETGLYESAFDPVERPSVTVPPVDNSLLIFENTPDSYHSFIANPRNTRNSVILWLHRTKESTIKRWPAEHIYKWSV